MQRSRPPLLTPETGKLSAAPAAITFGIACCTFALAVVLAVAVAAGD